MNTPDGYNNCEQIQAYFKFYTIPQAALLWCGVPADRVEEELALASPVGDSNSLLRSVLKHPYISCLEPRCRIIHEAIDNDLLPVGRDGGKVFLHKDIGPVARDRRTLSRESLKEWITNFFPNDKPPFLFDEIERKTHTAISVESYRALEIEKDAALAKLNEARSWAREKNKAYNTLLEEVELLKTSLNKLPPKNLPESERITMLKLIIGMAIDAYGYDPESNRNTATGDKNGISAKLFLKDINVSDDTVRKYLKEAKEWI